MSAEGNRTAVYPAVFPAVSPAAPRNAVRAAAAPAAVLALLLLAGCGGGADQASLDTAPEGGGAGGRAAEAPADAPREEGAEGGAEQGSGDTGGTGTDVDAAPREQVHTAALSVETEDVADAAEEAKELIADRDGYVERESMQDGGAPSGTLVLRVPEKRYEKALEELAGLGTRLSLEQEVLDVTEEVADVESRVESAEASLDRLRDLLEDAEGVDEVLAVEGEISTRQADLEALQARRASLENRTSYSTIELSLSVPESRVAEEPGDSLGFTGGLAYGWRALVGLAQALSVALGWLLPFAAVAAVLLAPVAWWRHRRGIRPAVPLTGLLLRRRRAAASRGPAGSGGEDGGESESAAPEPAETPAEEARGAEQAADQAAGPEGDAPSGPDRH
ncbi:DUF4349 domain-containing protein [Nocardiopsis potens]|uniref:DUF4349 domain-containing protein n=1 Tax=Nocardiopsis potens TaxID=1246458 RepID=UPI000348A8E0|nr:DUF4349 domain-containing protein [Nocardiopsis potens]